MILHSALSTTMAAAAPIFTSLTVQDKSAPSIPFHQGPHDSRLLGTQGHNLGKEVGLVYNT